MAFRYKVKDNITDGVGLLISILVRYPEVATIDFDPEGQVLKFNFIASRNLDSDEIKVFSLRLLDSIEAFNILENKDARLSLIDHQECGCYTMIEIRRDVETLVREEIALIVGLFREHLDNSLITDENQPLYEEDLQIQEEIIEQMLECIKGNVGGKKLFAYRDEGRVLVFNK